MNTHENVLTKIAELTVVRDKAAASILLLRNLLVTANDSEGKTPKPLPKNVNTTAANFRTAIPVDQIDPSTDEVIATYSSQSAASRAMGAKNISQAVRDGHMAGGYLWRRSDGKQVIKQSQTILL